MRYLTSIEVTVFGIACLDKYTCAKDITNQHPFLSVKGRSRNYPKCTSIWAVILGHYTW